MAFRVFFSSQSLGQSISSTRPQTLDQDRLPVLLEHVLSGADDYLGILDNADNVLQITLHETEGYVFDILDAEARRSLTRHLTAAEAQVLLASLPANLGKLDVDGFDAREWGRDWNGN